MLTVKDLAARWGCTDQVIYKYARQGKGGVKLQRLPMPHGYFFSPTAVEAFEREVMS